MMRAWPLKRGVRIDQYGIRCDRWLATCMKRMGMTMAEAELRAKISSMVVAPPVAPPEPRRPR
jgi:hypothetical protein